MMTKKQRKVVFEATLRDMLTQHSPSRDGGIKGKGVHLLIVDDPFKDRDEAESAAVSQRVYEWWTGTRFTVQDADED